MDVWVEADPYRSLAPNVREAELRREVDRSTEARVQVDGASPSTDTVRARVRC